MRLLRTYGNTGLAVCLLVAGALGVSGCLPAGQRSAASPDPAAHGATSLASRHPAGRPPAGRDLSSPQAAVRAYNDWVSYAYRKVDSEVATPTMTAEEGVRVDSYVEFNKQKAQGIDQKLTDLKTRVVSQTTTSAVVSAREVWTYRYFKLPVGTWSGPRQTASYEATYTLVPSGKGWVVAGVQARGGSGDK